MIPRRRAWRAHAHHPAPPHRGRRRIECRCRQPGQLSGFEERSRLISAIARAWGATPGRRPPNRWREFPPPAVAFPSERPFEASSGMSSVNFDYLGCIICSADWRIWCRSNWRTIPPASMHWMPVIWWARLAKRAATTQRGSPRPHPALFEGLPAPSLAPCASATLRGGSCEH